MKKKIIKYLAIARLSFSNEVVFVLDIFTLAFFGLFRVWILIELYTIAFQVGKNTQIGMNLTDTIWVLGLTHIFYTASRIRLLIMEIENEIHTGHVAYNITKPYSYILYHLYSTMGRIIANTGIAIICVSLLIYFNVGLGNFSLAGIIAGALLLFFGFIINSLIGILIGISAFWLEDLSGVRWIYDKIQYILGGIFIPLTIFPDWLRTITEVLPFANSFYNPSYLMVNYSPGLFMKYLFIQIFWVTALGLLNHFVYARSVRSISLNGG